MMMLSAQDAKDYNTLLVTPEMASSDTVGLEKINQMHAMTKLNWNEPLKSKRKHDRLGNEIPMSQVQVVDRSKSLVKLAIIGAVDFLSTTTTTIQHFLLAL